MSAQAVVVYSFEHEELPKKYNFESNVPVLVWEGKLAVDFREVYDGVKDYPD